MTELQNEIQRLKNEKNALILAHYYQNSDIRQIADVVGDSFELAKRAARSAKRLLVVCGVRFMAESAKILNPDKTVLLPRSDAGCPMADMVTPEDVAALRAAHPEAAVMCYVNSSAAVKAVCDVCCTSSSAVRIAQSLPEREIIFVPDKNLGAYVASQVKNKVFHLHSGFCPIHHDVTPETAKAVMARNSGAVLLAHPECRPEVAALAAFVGSTTQIIDCAVNGDATAYIIGTEAGIVEYLRDAAPGKAIVPLSEQMVCGDMKKTELEDVLSALERGVNEIILPDAEMTGARGSLEKMIAM